MALLFPCYCPQRTTEGTALPTDFTFAGQRFDASAGLMYYGARYYDAALGRFISADTLVPGAGNPQTLNRYAYVRNNPVKYVDPTGHRACGGPEDLDCDTPSGVGTAGECDLSCVEPQAETGEQHSEPDQNKRLCANGTNDYCGVNLGFNLAPVAWFAAGRCPHLICAAALGKIGDLMKIWGTSAGVTYAWDNYGNHYFGVWGAPIGETPGPIPLSFSSFTGDIIPRDGSKVPSVSFDNFQFSSPNSTELVSQDQTKNFMTGPFANVTGGLLNGGGITISNGGIGIEKDLLMTPQLSGAIGYTWELPKWSWLPSW